jgi:3-dehydroquinate synthase
MMLFVKRIRVRLPKNSYDVMIANGLLSRAGREIKRLLPGPSSRVFVITSPSVRRFWGETLERSLHQAKLNCQVLEMNDGEPAKRLDNVEQLAEQMVAAQADRKSMVMALGGGVVGDCAGFLAAVFLRGIPVVQIPTTLLAQVDASIGGKTGVNLRAGKNLIGAFHQPRAVLVDPQVLSTLPEREFRAGLFESLKCGVIRDRALFDYMVRKVRAILARDRKALERVISDSIRVKAAVVSADEKESDLRRILNFGHTIGHALEAATGYTEFLHGEAVGWGMTAAAAIAGSCGFCSPETSMQITNAVKAYGPLPPVRSASGEIVNRLSADKKTVAGAVHFVLPLKIGKVTIASDVPPDVVRQSVELIRTHA